MNFDSSHDPLLNSEEAAEFLNTTREGFSKIASASRYNLRSEKIKREVYYRKSILRSHINRNLMPY